MVDAQRRTYCSSTVRYSNVSRSSLLVDRATSQHVSTIRRMAYATSPCGEVGCAGRLSVHSRPFDWLPMSYTRVPGQRRQRPLSVDDPRRPDGKRQGFTPREFDALLARQGGLCALCGKPADGAPWAVDHDHIQAVLDGHDPGRGCPRCFRGIVHMKENTGLGMFGDDPEQLRRAARYVEARRGTRSGLRKALEPLGASRHAETTNDTPALWRGGPVPSR